MNAERPPFPRTERTTIGRSPERGTADRAAAEAILDEGVRGTLVVRARSGRDPERLDVFDEDFDLAGACADLGLAVLGTLEREDLDAIVDSVEEFFGEFGGVVGGGFVPPGMSDDVGEPLYGEPGTARSVDVATGVLIEMLGALAGDPKVADCALDQLYATARIDQLYEIVDSYQYDDEPSAEAQDVFFAALTACDG